jgi:hypothetical protein
MNVLENLKTRGSKRISQRHGYAVGGNIDFKIPLVVFDIDATLVLDDSSAIEPTVQMLKTINKSCRIFLITARHPSMKDETITELGSVGITPNMYESLLLSPPADRTSMHKVGLWKSRMRKEIAFKAQCPISITIGDQWTDMIAVQSEEEMQELDAGFMGVGSCAKYALVRPHDGISLLGLKLAYT